MKRLNRLSHCGFALLALAVLLAGIAFPASHAAAAPDPKTFYLSYPYEAPPKGNLNDFNTDGLTNGGFGAWSHLITPTFGYYVNATNEWKGWLAKSWGFSSDGTKYTITLRDDLTWSDGSKLTSKDVVDTFLLILLQPSGGTGEFGAGLDTFDAVDDYTIDFKLAPGVKPSLILQRLIMLDQVVSSEVYGQFADKVEKLLSDGKSAGKSASDIQGSDDWKKLQTDLESFRPDHILSSGPYTLDLKDVTDSQLVMHRTDKTPFGKNAKFDNLVIYKGDTDVSTPLIESGDVYYATDYFPPPTEKTFTDKGIKILRAPSYTGPGLIFNQKVYPLSRQDVRQAIAYAIDRNRADKVSYAQIGQPIKYMADFSDTNLPKYLTADQIKALNPYNYDQQKAADILTKAGFTKNSDGEWVDDKGKPMEFELSAPADFTDFMPVAQDVTDQLTTFGIKITLKAIPNEQHVPYVLSGQFQMAIRLWGYPSPLPYYAYRYAYLQNSIGRAVTSDKPGTSYTDKDGKGTVDGQPFDFKALVAQIAAGTDPAPQNAAVAQAAAIANKDLPVIPLVERFYNCPLITTNISGLPPDDDPIWQNVSGVSNAINVLLMNGTIGPKTSS
jgi:peptide/nickel transport system substrate-binding protein